ncbi:Zn-ribbon domain-containing OB-fold protein [Novosphingobium bradum]|uniref:Zn-ribbon domain-containing OB-fold protein n=1 Tax=Novosphingobium bradum TaxID=1737444 RepID=A0ABV7IMV6_9SPHN
MAARREQDFHWAAVDRGELVVQQCRQCAKLRHPPLPRCAACGSLDWHEHPLSGLGRIISWVILTHPGGKDAVRRTGILVELDEGIRVVSNLVDQENAAIGARVRVEFGEPGPQRLALFRTLAETPA